MTADKKRFIAKHPKDKPITIIVDSATDVPLVTAPRFGYQLLLDILNENGVKVSSKDHVNVQTVEAYPNTRKIMGANDE